MFDPVDPKQSFPALERGILQYWKEEDLFRRSVELRQDGEVFSFYDGPPFATGLPHYGHLLGGTIKDVIPRYQTMRGKRVERRFGWDCHGLPVEYEVEKERGINAKTDVETIGIKAFNDACRGIVQRFAAEWRVTVERMGRWVDMDLDYKTMDPAYMESIWWVFSKLHEKNLIYEGYKPMHVCPRCVTPLSNFEVTQGYKEVTDRSAIAMFRMKDEEDGENSEEKTGRHSRSSQLAANSSPVSFLAWTTTPWTLPGNVFLAVHPAVTYALVAHEGDTYVVAEELVARVFGERPHEVTGTVRGKELIGKRYEPLFPYFAEQYATTGFRVVAGEFVTTEDGTGIVHIAPGFGEDDFAIGAREGVPLLQHVTMDGRFTPAVTDFAGQEVKPKDDPTKTDQKIAAWLEERGLLFESASYRHTYPHCWRCDSPLLNYATSSWFVAVERLKDDLLQVNKETAWVPAHVRDGRFGKWLENARDWAISRNRYWGTPLPVWRSDETGETTVIRSRDDLMARAQIRFTKVSAIRHGQSENNVVQVYEGTEPGSGLTKLGKTQADDAGKRLAAEHLDVIYCSPLLRTRETAERIAKQTGARIVVDDRIRETNMGDYEGTNYDFHDLAFVKARRAQELAKDAPGSIYDLPGMETPDAIFDRISAFLRDILPRHRSEHIAIVSHGSPLTHIRRFFTGDDYAKLAAQRMQRNCAIQTFFWDHDHEAQMDLHKDVIDSIVWPAQEGDAVSEVTLVRHGETDWNKNRIMQGGQGDPPLNETGRLQAAELAASLHGKHFDAIVCSPQRRCQETAEILSRELGLPITETLASLRERECGDWTGTDEAAFLAAHPTLHGSPSVTMHHMSFRDGESLSQFLQRVTQSYEHLLRHYAGKKVLVVTHGGVMRAWHSFLENLSYRDAVLQDRTPNCALFTFGLKPLVRRIPDVLDCWFESGSMPYALPHYPFEAASYEPGATSTRNASRTSKLLARNGEIALPVGFPADFIAEGIDQTRGWFYTLTVLSTALFNRPAFRNVIVNGIVLAEDGRKMSKRLKNYPDPGALMEQYGADALRFTLMHSPAVRAEDLRFSEKAVEETLRSVLLPLWNSYSFFVTYANAAGFEPARLGRTSPHPLDRWIRAEVQDLLNRITQQLDRYELSAACGEIFSTVDALTNWYIRLSRRRFAGKGGGEGAEAMASNFEEDRHNALSTLYDVLLTLQQILAPFCPFLADAVYLNLAGEEHGSIHLTDWPATRALTAEETALLYRNRLLRTVVSLGLKIRSEQKVKVRTPLSRLTVAVPQNLRDDAGLGDDDLQLLRQELNVKEVVLTDDPGTLGERIALVDARKAGPRLGKRVQEIIAAGKAGAFSVEDDGSVRILDETLGPEEVSISYRGADGVNVASDRGIVVSIDTAVTPELQAEGQARDLIRAIQKLRKEEGLAHTDRIALMLEGCDDLLAAHGSLLLQETNAILQDNDGPARSVELEDGTVRVRFTKHGATSTS